MPNGGTQVTSWLGELEPEEKLSVKHRSAWPELKGWSDDGVMAPLAWARTAGTHKTNSASPSAYMHAATAGLANETRVSTLVSVRARGMVALHGAPER